MDEIINEQNNIMLVIAEQKSNVKVTRNFRGYTWSVKVLDGDVIGNKYLYLKKGDK